MSEPTDERGAIAKAWADYCTQHGILGQRATSAELQRLGFVGGFLAGRASVTQPQAYSIWTPLRDEPITLNTSREQLQAIANEMQGVNVYPGWAVFMGAEIERILKESLGVVPSTGNKETP